MRFWLNTKTQKAVASSEEPPYPEHWLEIDKARFDQIRANDTTNDPPWEIKKATDPIDWQWRCDVCHKTRPDEFISVYKRPYKFTDFPGGITMVLNVKYCNDNPACVAGAKQVDFGLTPEKKEQTNV